MVRLGVGHQHSWFLSILGRYMDYNSVFGSRSDFHDRRTPVCLCVGQQHLKFWPILARFMDYYSLFWGPGVISTIDEPLGAFTCRSSTLAGFVDSDSFRGLLLTVLGSQRDFHFCRTPRCACVLVVKSRSFGRYWPVSWIITHCFGVPE